MHEFGNMGRLIGLAWLLVGIAPAVAQEPETETPPFSQGFDRRVAAESAIAHNPYAMMPHRPSYLLPLALNTKSASDQVGGMGEVPQDLELKYQFSFKLPIWEAPLGEQSQLWFAYTQQSHWQAYNRDASAPFRETNHEPELLLSWLSDFTLLGLRNRALVVGVNHQSNGRSDPDSRSWNRLTATAIMERGNWGFALRLWQRLPEALEEDDNPDIEDYLGHGELTAIALSGRTRMGVTLRHNPKTGKGAVMLEWTHPIANHYRGYIQFFSGYGESLIDYDTHINRIGIGVLLADWV